MNLMGNFFFKQKKPSGREADSHFTGCLRKRKYSLDYYVVRAAIANLQVCASESKKFI